jgi:hypothetical protein
MSSSEMETASGEGVRAEGKTKGREKHTLGIERNAGNRSAGNRNEGVIQPIGFSPQPRPNEYNDDWIPLTARSARSARSSGSLKDRIALDYDASTAGKTGLDLAELDLGEGTAGTTGTGIGTTASGSRGGISEAAAKAAGLPMGHSDSRVSSLDLTGDKDRELELKIRGGSNSPQNAGQASGSEHPGLLRDPIGAIKRKAQKFKLCGVKVFGS